jgi:hypothetical protein
MLLCLAALSFTPLARAQDPEPTLDEPTADPSSDPVAAPTATGKKRKFLMEVGFRGRYMDLPDSILDLAYFRNDDDDLIPDRPHVSAYSLGIEFVVKDKQANGIFYVEYLNPLIQPGYWDDKEEPAAHDDGSWIEPDKFGLVMIGANYAYEIKANSWFSFLFGAGIGGAIRIGNLDEWQPGECDPDTQDCSGVDTSGNNNADVGCDPAGTANAAAYARKDDCPVDSVIDMPPALPYLDINIGPRFNIADHASIRLEGGVHAFLPYGGATLGIVF